MERSPAAHGIYGIRPRIAEPPGPTETSERRAVLEIRLRWPRLWRPQEVPAHWLLWLPECVLIAGVLWVGHAVCPGLTARPKTVLWPALSWALVRLAAGRRLPEGERGARFALVVVGWLALWGLYAAGLRGGLLRMHGAMAAFVLAGLTGLRAWRARGAAHPAAESLRLVGAAGAGLWLMRDFLTSAAAGGEDARAYSHMLADMLAQVRAGVFPVYVGQTPYQFNGAVYSIRIAPAFHYLGALLDLLTLRALDVNGVQNLLLALLGAGAVVVAYLCLAALAPGRRTLALLLAFLFAACPGVAGIPHDGDLYMTWVAAPFVPLTLYGLVRGWRRRDGVALACVAGGLGAVWWAHTPVAVWLTAVACLFLAAGLARLRPLRPALAWMAATAAAAGLAAAYPLVSNLGVPIKQGLPPVILPVSAGAILYFVRTSFPAALLPVSKLGRVFTDYQLGYSGWILWLGGLAAAWRLRSAVLCVLMMVATGFLLLLCPFRA